MKKAILAWIVICACFLTGCAPLSITLQRGDQPISLPAPTARQKEPAIGDSVSGRIIAIQLYYVSSDRQRLVPVRHTLIVEPGQSAVEKAVKALMNQPTGAEALNVIPEGTQLESVRVSGNVAVVDLSIDARNVENEQQLYWMQAALASTLTQLEGIEYVQLLIEGQSESIMSLPTGATAAGDGDLAAAWARLTAEQELLAREQEEDAKAASAQRTAILYYASRDGQFLIPEARTIEIRKDDFITPLIQALMERREDDGAVRSPFPADTRVLSKEVEIIETENGRRLIRLAFDANLIATLEREGLSAWQLYAALTYTLTGFVPDIDGLIVLIGDGLLTRTVRDGEEITFTGGEMDVLMYPDAVGRLATVHLGCTDGGLLPLSRPMNQKSAVSPRALMGELFKGPMQWEEGAARVLPDGVTLDDVLGVRVIEGEAIVNLSSNLYKCCQGLTAQQERSLIYAIVNTLTELETISAVRFQVEGESVDQLVSEMFLRGPLMRNPGLIVEREEAKAAEETEETEKTEE